MFEAKSEVEQHLCQAAGARDALPKENMPTGIRSSSYFWRNGVAGAYSWEIYFCEVMVQNSISAVKYYNAVVKQLAIGPTRSLCNSIVRTCTS
jgi:hypothetical protein